MTMIAQKCKTFGVLKYFIIGTCTNVFHNLITGSYNIVSYSG